MYVNPWDPTVFYLFSTFGRCASPLNAVLYPTFPAKRYGKRTGLPLAVRGKRIAGNGGLSVARRASTPLP